MVISKHTSLPLFAVLVALVTLAAGPAHAATAKAAPKAKTEAITLKISNLTTATKAKEVKKLEKAVQKVKGVTKVAVSKKKGELTVRVAVGTDRATIVKAVEGAGFAIAEPKDEKAPVPADAPDESEDAGSDE